MQHRRRGAGPEGPGTFALRLWLWAVPLVMLLGAVVFGLIAALDGRWPLFGMMVLVALFALGLLFLHYWAMYRFGREEETPETRGPGRSR